VARFVLRGMLTRKLRTILTSIAILLGVSMIAGTFIITDQIDRAFGNIFEKANSGTDVVLSHKTDFTTDQGQAGPLPESVIGQTQKVAGVKQSVGEIQAAGGLVVNGKYKASEGGAPNIVFSYTPEPFNTADLTQGHFPNQTSEIAVNTKFAEDQKLKLGQGLGLTTENGVVPVRLVGIFKPPSEIGGATLIITTFADAQQWYNRVGKASIVLVQADKGVSPDTLAGRIRDSVPGFVKVQTGEQNAKEQSDQISGDINGFLKPVLLTFAGVAVFVGAFIIFNTFSITVAQRTREFAMLRTIGATRRQVMWAVIGEAALVGLLSALIGLAVGAGFAALINALFDALGAGLPVAPLRITQTAILVSLIVGVGMTVLSALAPAFRATRVQPVAALREGATLPPGRFSRFTGPIAGVVVVGGLALLLYALFSTLPTTVQLLMLAAGAILIFLGVAVLSRYLIRPGAAVLGWPMKRIAPASGRLALENAARNPARTAVTASALMVGLGVVVFVAVFANGIKVSFTDALDKSIKSDLIVQNQNGFGIIPQAATSSAASAPGVQSAASIRFDETHIKGHGSQEMNGVEPGLFSNTYKFDWLKGGSDELIHNLKPHQALIEEQTAKSTKLNVGDSFTATGSDGGRATLHIVGEYKDPTLMTGYIVPVSTFDKVSPLEGPSIILVNFNTGADPKATQAAVTDALKAFPQAKVQSNAEYKQSVSDQLGQLLNFVYVLLAMSVVISLFGIVNTLALSVFERTREIGMLRAIGTTRRQLRRIIRWESVITAIMGGLLGIAVGVVFAWIVSFGLKDQGIVFSLPYGQVIVALVVAAIVGVVAATWPARRAARLNILDALHYE
jgi:putative ABC transport system permease protein